MSFRPWVIITLGIVALLINGVLVFQEDMPSVVTEVELGKVQEPLRTITYSNSNRRQNLEVMGLSTELANKAANRINYLAKDEKRWLSVLNQDRTNLSAALCPNGEVPQPYAMLRFLVYEDAERRYVIDAGSAIKLEPRLWYDTSFVPAIYDHLERTERRKADATIMGVSAAMLNMEGAALDGVTPWSMGALGTWSYPALQKKNPRLQLMVIHYFALMHYLTELANRPAGLCS